MSIPLSFPSSLNPSTVLIANTDDIVFAGQIVIPSSSFVKTGDIPISPDASQIVVTPLPSYTDRKLYNISFSSPAYRVVLDLGNNSIAEEDPIGLGVKVNISNSTQSTIRIVTVDFTNSNTGSKYIYYFIFNFDFTFGPPRVKVGLYYDRSVTLDTLPLTPLTIPISEPSNLNSTSTLLNTLNATPTSSSASSTTPVLLKSFNVAPVKTCNCVKPNLQEIILGNINPNPLVQECACISVPILTISGQTLVDGSDIGDNIFTIIDEFQYYCPKQLPSKDNHCGVFHVKESQLKKTVFNKCCPKIVSVVIGEGATLFDKLVNIFITLGRAEIGVDFDVFYPRIFFYAMLKYILARILYGHFDVDFLLGKYNEKFLKDLGNSRFCEALHLFLDCDSIVFGYNRYFKFEKECKK